MSKLDIIIPVYNEDENIVRLIKLLEKEVSCSFRILICYDSESDKTLVHLRDNNIIKNEILLIKNAKQGPNSAILTGIKSSNSKIVLVFMADDFENVKLINNMVDLIDKGNDLIILYVVVDLYQCIINIISIYFSFNINFILFF